MTTSINYSEIRKENEEIKAKLKSTHIQYNDLTRDQWFSLLHAKAQERNKPLLLLPQRRVHHKDIIARQSK